MRIAVDARFYGLENTGLGRYTTNVVSHLPGFLPDHTLVILLRKQYAGLKLPKNCEAVEAEFPHYSLAEQIGLPRLLTEKNCDLLYSLHFNVPLRVDVPFIVTIHDLIKSHFSGSGTTTRSPWLFRIKRWGYDLTIRHAVHDSRHIIVPSNSVKNDILATVGADPAKITVVKEAPDAIFRKKVHKSSTIPLPEKYLLFVGNAYPHKNIRLVLDALADLPEYHLVIVAKDSPFLNRTLTGYDRSRIHVFSGISDSDLVQVYTRAHALVTPSFIEGYGLPGIEAAMVGTPVIASDIPVYREVYEDRALYVDPHSVQDLVRAVRQVKKKAAFTIERSWAEVSHEIAEVIRESSPSL